MEKRRCPQCQELVECEENQPGGVVCPGCGYTSDNFTKLLPCGFRVGDYEIRDSLGAGGMGEVYLAEQLSMKRLVALKILHTDLAKDQGYMERFFREVRTLAQIEHPNVVQAIEVGIDDRICFFSMMYIQGMDLKSRIKEQKVFDELEALRIIRVLVLALKHVWDKHGLLHRDIKPANIIVTPEHEVKLMDLGISKKISETSDLTIAGMMVGSPTYVSPEQARAEKNLDFRADMYSLAATYFNMIVGEPPFVAETSMAVIACHLSKPVPDPRESRPELSAYSFELIRKMMAKNKKDRFPNWDEAICVIDKIIELLARKNEGESLAESLPEEMREGRSNIEKPSSNFMNMTLIQSLFSNRLRIALIVSLAIVFVAFASLAMFSVRESKSAKAKRYYEKAMAALNDTPVINRRNVVGIYTIFEKVQKTGDAYYASLAKEEKRRILNVIRKNDRKKVEATARRQLNELERKSAKLASEKKFDQAIELWKKYERDGKYTKILRKDINRAIEYLEISKRKYNEGLSYQ